MKKTNLLLSALVVFLFSAIFVISAAVAQPPRPGQFQPPKARFDVNRSIKDNLAMQGGRDVVIHLKSGQSIQGYIKAIGDRFVHLERLAGGRDYYDALIRIDDIAALEARARGER
ncbi:MAG TPA: hypothetical protein P5294_11070 [Smithellaceae bacterium]|nr:hypothetical protein [Smithellaceae bacterium]HRS90241.1 hypothetical protein [Smithellaceae bacterium]HRV27070.1 hypothetical protein [Smithellaceae bacterium]